MSSTFRYNLLNDFTVNDLFVLSTTVSSSLSTGALQVSGGFALNSSGNIGGILNMNSNRIINIAVPTNSSDAVSKSYVDALSVSFNTTNLVVNGTIQSVSTGTGSLQIYGGVGIGGNIYTGGIIVSGGTQVVNSAGTNTILSSGTLSIINNPTFSGITTISNSTTSINTATGALIVNGGIGAGTIYSQNHFQNGNQVVSIAGTNVSTSGGILSVINNPTFSGIVNISNSTVSSSTATGSLILAGGLGVNGNIYAGSIFQNGLPVPSISGTNISISSGIISVISNPTFSGNTTISSTIDSISSTSTASLVVSGGLSINKSLFIGNSLNVQSLSITGYLGGAWLNLPTTGPSAIGNGGAGVNPMLGYINSNGTYYTNSLVGDTFVKSRTGRIVFGNTATSSSIAIQNDLFGIGNVNPAYILDVTGLANFATAIQITGTTNATNATSGGTLTVLGGVSVSKKMYIGSGLNLSGSISGNISLNVANTTGSYNLILPTSIASYGSQALLSDTSGNLSWSSLNYSTSTFNAQQNVTNQNVTGLVLNSTNFDIFLQANVSATTNLNSLFELRGIINGAGSWVLSTNFVGDTTNITFGINASTGQIYYSSPSFTGWTSTVFKYSTNASTTPNSFSYLSVGTSYTATGNPTAGNFFTVNGSNFTDNSLTASSTATNWSSSFLGIPTLSATNTNITTTRASTLEIVGAPIAGTNETILNSYSLNIDSGIVRIAETTNAISTSTGAMQISGGLGIGGNIYCNTLNSNSFNTTSLSQITLSSTTGGNIFNLLCPNLVANQNVFFGIGTSISNGNSGYINFINTTVGSISNSMNLGIYGQNPQVVIQNNGFVGINNPNPSYQLDILGTSRVSGIALFTNSSASTGTGSGSVIISGGVGVNGSIYAGSMFSNGFQVLTNASNTFQTISITGTNTSTNTGNGSLTVAGGVGIAGTINCNSLNASSTSQITLSGTGGGNIFNLLDPNLSNGSGIYLAIGTNISNANVGYMNFVNTTSGSIYNSMNFGIFGQANNSITIQNNGCVGINNPNPGSSLDVAGNIVGRGVIESAFTLSSGYNTVASNQDQSYGFAAFKNSPGAVNRGILLLNLSSGVGAGSSIDFANGATSTPSAQIQGNDDGNSSSNILFLTRTSGASVTAQPLERMRILSTGFVGINTQNPSFQLDVAGQTRISSNLTIGNSSASTYLEILGSGAADTRLYSHSDGNTYLQSAGLFTVANINSVSSRITVDTSGNLTTAGNINTNGVVQSTNFVSSGYNTVASNQNASYAFAAYKSSSGAVNRGILLWNTGGGAGAGTSIDFSNYASSTPSAQIQAIDDGNSSSNLIFLTRTTGTTGSTQPIERLRINSSGGVIIPGSLTAGDTTISGNMSTQYIGPTNDNSKSIGTGILRYQTIFLVSNPTVGSARFLKKDIAPISNALDFVKVLEPKRYKLKDSDETSYGFIAEEVHDLLKIHSDDPEIIHSLVYLDPETENPRALKYGEFCPILWSAVRELIEQTTSLQKELELLKKENLEFKNRLEFQQKL